MYTCNCYDRHLIIKPRITFRLYLYLLSISESETTRLGVSKTDNSERSVCVLMHGSRVQVNKGFVRVNDP